MRRIAGRARRPITPVVPVARTFRRTLIAAILSPFIAAILPAITAAILPTLRPLRARIVERAHRWHAAGRADTCLTSRWRGQNPCGAFELFARQHAQAVVAWCLAIARR